MHSVWVNTVSVTPLHIATCLLKTTSIEDNISLLHATLIIYL